MPHPQDIHALIAGDHRLVETLFGRLQRGEGDRAALGEQVAFNLSLHATGEEEVVYPAIRKHLADGDHAADQVIDEHQVMKECLAAMAKSDAGEPAWEEALQKLIAEVTAHVPEEEETLLPALRRAVGDDEMVALGQAFTKAKSKAPTHPHPHAPSTPPGNVLAGAAAVVVDKVRDLKGDRAAVVATDASGILDADCQAVVDAIAAQHPLPIELLTPDKARKQPTAADGVNAVLKDRKGSTDPEPVEIVQDRSIDGPSGPIPVRVYIPVSNATALPVIVYVHGGGWVIADNDVYDATPRALANKTGAMVISVEYRKGPEDVFPAAHDDVLAVTRAVMSGAVTQIGGDPSRVAIAGESAGGNMAAATCLQLKQHGEPLPLFQLLVYPVAKAEFGAYPSYLEATDAQPLHSAMIPWFGLHYLADPSQATDPRIALVDVPAAELAGLPPALVITAERDPLRDEGEAFAANLQAAGVPTTLTRYDGVCHEFFGMAAVVAKAEQAQQQAAAALIGAFGTTGPSSASATSSVGATAVGRS